MTQEKCAKVNPKLSKLEKKHDLPYEEISYSAEAKPGADRDETPPRTPTGNAPSSESDIDVSSPANDLVVSQEEDERLAKELSLKEAAAHDLSHRPKRRRFHESYNFNMKCPTPGCNSLGKGTNTQMFSLDLKTDLPGLDRYFSLPQCHSCCFFFFFKHQATSQEDTRDISRYQGALCTTISRLMNARYT